MFPVKDDSLPLDSTNDSDGDGVANNLDAFPLDATETADADSDGVGDNSDAYPNNNLYALDSDNDGMPDAWEIANKLDPNVANANGRELSTAYDNIEVYFNSLVKSITENQN